MRIAICDDNPQHVRQYTEKLSAIGQKHGLTSTIDQYANGEQLLFAQEDAATRADIIFLDIRMPGRNGVDIAHALREMQQDGEIIFFTHSTDNMLDAFDVDALHYIVKGQTSDEKNRRDFFACDTPGRAKASGDDCADLCGGKPQCASKSDFIFREHSPCDTGALRHRDVRVLFHAG